MQNKLVQKLWLCEPLYLPALRATFLQRKAFKKVCAARISMRLRRGLSSGAPRHLLSKGGLIGSAFGAFFMPAEPASELASD